MEFTVKFLVCVVFFGYADAITSEEESEIKDVCCGHIELMVAGLPTLESCLVQEPPDYVEYQPGEEALCRVTIATCCREQFKDKDSCAAGMKLASSKRCSTPSSDIGKTCCEECSFGTITGESQGKESCGSQPDGEGVSLSSFLRKDAYYKCCLEAANKPETTTEKKSTTTSTTSTTTEKPRESCKGDSCAHHCDDSDGVVRCSCREGFRLQADKKTCNDINECLEAEDDLCTAADTVCHNIPGTFKCVPIKKRDLGLSCPPGFKRNVENQVCDDINECQLPRPPCPKYLCENTIGGYKCSGKPGKPFEELVPGAPRSTDPPSPEDGTPKNDICPPGFRAGVDDECDDIDECKEASDDCQHLSQHCINTHGSFFCQDHVSKRCAPGFKVNTATGICEDIDECEESSEVCRRTEVCINLPGAYNCKSKISQLPKLTTKNCQEGTRLKPGGKICEDIDECREGTHLCDQFQNCINTFGAHECRCKNGFELDTTSGSCEDVDECALKLDNCSPGFTCLNVLGSFTCTRQPPTSRQTTTSTTLPPGDYEYYYSDEDNSTENEVLPTPPKPTPSKSTTPKPTTLPPTTTSTPRSRPTYPPRTTPKPTRRPYTPYRPADRRPPTERPTRPEDRPETSTADSRSSTTPDDRRLESAPTSPENPRPVYNPDTPNRPEDPIDNARRPTDRTPDRRPVYYPYGPYRPENRTPTRRPIESTTPEDPIDNESSRPDTRRPTNTVPSYPPMPSLPPRPTDPTTPTESNRPTYPTDPSRPSRPYNPRRPEYPRRPGYPRRPDDPRRPGGRWPPYRRPTTITDVPTTTPEIPTTTAVAPGFNPDDVHCLYGFEKDQYGNCIEKTSSVANGFNTDLHCLAGFEKDRYGNCIDINECEKGQHTCKSLEVCVNKAGGYGCECILGFRRADDGWCVVIATPSTSTTTTTSTTTRRPFVNRVPSTPEWSYNPLTPRPTPRQPDYPIAHTGICNDLGYKFDLVQGKCIDIDECVEKKHTCTSIEECVNMDGGFRCVCGPQCRAEEDRHMGRVPVEPPPPPPLPRQPADPASNVITVGSQYGQRGVWSPRPTNAYTNNGDVITSCPWGYKLTPEKRCYDIDECALNASSCGPQQRCENFYGGYSCQCPAGHKLAGQNRCEDIDECVHGNPCSYNSKCINTVGSYRCECSSGFRNAPSNDKVCVDVDECTEMRNVCEQHCSNAWGGYRCFCNRGYRLASDNRTCDDVNECEEWSSLRGTRAKLCAGDCINVHGSYKCGCPSGYRLSEDQRSCIDIDECESGEASCAGSTYPGQVCQNTRGSYHCHQIECPQGYRLESKHRCSRIQRSCSISDWECLQRPGSYSYNFITFVSNIYIPAGSVDLFTMHGPSWSESVVSFELRMIRVQASPGVTPADLRCFDMRPSNNVCVISLLCSLPGPQVAELELSMSLYQRGLFAGKTVARLVVIVSQYDF